MISYRILTQAPCLAGILCYSKQSTVRRRRGLADFPARGGRGVGGNERGAFSGGSRELRRQQGAGRAVRRARGLSLEVSDRAVVPEP